MSSIKYRIANFIGYVRFAAAIAAKPANRKYFWRWLNSLQSDYFIRQRLPWLTFEAIERLGTLDLKGKNVFEYGSGGSTLFWLDKGAKVVSVEHDLEWYQRLQTITARVAELDYRFVEPERDADPKTAADPADPELYFSDDSASKGYHYRRYVQQIDEFADQFFDLVLIDGRARPSCIAHAAQKVKVGGCLVLDNSDRDYYLARTLDKLVNFECQKTEGVGPGINLFSHTTLYFRKR